MNTRLLGSTLISGLIYAFSAGCEGGTESPPPPKVEVSSVAEELEAAVCDVVFGCECAYGRQFDTPGECSTWASEQQALAEQLTAQPGMEWDPTCVGWYVRAFEELECGSQELLSTDFNGDGCNQACSPIHGQVPVGGSCVFDSGFSNCDRGLICPNGQCVDPCGGAGEGEICDGGFARCGDGLYCGFLEAELESRCLPRRAEGAECQVDECAEGLSCVSDPADPTLPRLCQTLAELGGACMGHGECDSGYCPAGFCDVLPGDGGDCRGTGVCAEGFFCDGETCGALKQPGDPCTNSCGGGLECLDSVCAQTDSYVCYPGNIVEVWD